MRSPLTRRPRTWHTGTVRPVGTALLGALALVLLACGGDDAATAPGTQRVVLLAYDSFVPSPDVFEPFTAETGIEVEIARSGDAGELVSKAILTAGNPEGDVLWGVDDTLLVRALEADVFVPYAAEGLDDVPERLRSLVPGNEVTPVDEGDVCVNYDIAALEALGLDPPTSFADLADERYRGLLVVQNPVTSSPGLAFMLATIAEHGDDAWLDYWRALRANDVLVVDGWSGAYYQEFTRAGGSRPLVVSYGTSPPAEIVFADPPLPEGAPPPTGVVSGTCYRQVEFAGILRGSRQVEAAQQLIDYLLSPAFQDDLPLTQFVFPANERASLPAVFTDNIVRPERSLALDPATVAEQRLTWIDQWTAAVLR